MKSETKNIKLSLALLLFTMLALTPAANAAQIWTDQEDYGPDEIVYISGTGFDIYSVITMTIVGPDEWGADQFDSLNSPWWVYWSFKEPDRFDIAYLKVKCLGTFYVTATDGTNTATTTFTDAPKVGTVTVGAQSPDPVTAGDNATYTITVNRGSGGGSPGAFTANLSITTALPTGASASFSPNPVSFTPSQNSRTSTLTISTGGTTPAGSYPFTVKASTSASDFATGSGTLVVDEEGPPPDETPPVVSSIVRTDPNPTNAASVDFTVTFSESVTGVDTTDFSLTTTGGISGAAVTGVSGSGSIYTVTVSTGTGDGTIRLDVADDDSIADLAGNKLGGTGTGNGDFTTGEFYTIDATPPTADIDVSDTLINEADDDGTFDVIVTFSEPMNTASIPLIGFSPNVVSSGTLSFYDGVWSNGNTVYTATYDVADVDEEVAGVDIGVSGAQDLVGNHQAPDPTIETDLFDVDTIAPTVIDISVSDTLINEADAGGTFDVTVTFSEAMDTLTTPTIGFNADVKGSGTLAFVSGAWSAGDTVYTTTYNIADIDEEQADIDVSVSGAKDLAENLQDPDPATETDMFDVDTLAPTGSITINGDAIYTNSVNVTLNLSAIDGSEIEAYRLADGTDASGETETTITPIIIYIEDVPWILTGGNGIKTVAVQYRDVAGNWSENYTDSIVLIDVLSAITAGGCPFDKDTVLEGQQFRIIFTQDPTNMSTYKLTASNPGQFFYNIFFIGTPEETANLSIDVPEPFVTQGAMPVHVYANVSFDGDCFVPADQIAVFAAQLGNNPDYDLAVPIPDTGLVYVRIHLDYGLKKDVGYTRDGSNNAEKPIGTDAVVDLTEYEFVVGGDMDDAVIIQNENVFKKIPGFGGMVLDGYGDPVETTITIIGPGVNATVYTDEDGFYYLYYKHKGKDALFTLTCGTQSKTEVMKANKYVEINFVIP